MNYYKIVLLLVFFTSIIGCNKGAEFTIEKGKVGKITQSTQVQELAKIFKNDSIVIKLGELKKGTDKNKYFTDDDEYMIYNKEGKHLLTIVPIEQHDSLSTIKSVEIFSNKYQTKEGISLYSPYRDINSAYNISITNTLLSAHIDIDKLNATMSIDKKEIGVNEFNREKIRKDQIPDLAKINHFTIWFN